MKVLMAALLLIFLLEADWIVVREVEDLWLLQADWVVNLGRVEPGKVILLACLWPTALEGLTGHLTRVIEHETRLILLKVDNYVLVFLVIKVIDIVNAHNVALRP